MIPRYQLSIARLLTLSILALSLPAVLTAEAPDGWFLAGSQPSSFDTGLDSEEFATGSNSAFLSSKPDLTEINGFGTLMQNISATKYRGQRVRLSAQIKSQQVKSWAGMWLRVDGEKPPSLAFDNMQSRPIRGDTDWQRYEIVLDVPEESIGIAFGILINGTGRVWLDNLSLDPVDSDVPVTNTRPPIPTEPTNLDFEGF